MFPATGEAGAGNSSTAADGGIIRGCGTGDTAPPAGTMPIGPMGAIPACISGSIAFGTYCPTGHWPNEAAGA